MYNLIIELIEKEISRDPYKVKHMIANIRAANEVKKSQNIDQIFADAETIVSTLIGLGHVDIPEIEVLEIQDLFESARKKLLERMKNNNNNPIKLV